MTQENLIVQKEVELIQKAYRPDDMLRAMIYGVSGTGKTYSLRTARRPIHLDSFDPNGSQSIDDCIAEGYVYADTRFEVEDPAKPTCWKLWSSEIKRRFAAGYFNHIGTYATDLTSMSAAAMNEVLLKAGRPGGTPQQNDWLPQMTMLENAMRYILSFPCDVIVLAHVNIIKDEIIGKLSYSPLITGKLVIRVPLMFSEIYVAITRETAKGLEYRFLTQAAGSYTARTRLGKGGKFLQYEVPNYKALLTKAEKSTEDKPY
jgi:hypothetical protein